MAHRFRTAFYKLLPSWLTAEDGELVQYSLSVVIEATILKVYPAHAFRVSVSVPAADVAIDEDKVATLGTVTPTITVVDDP